MRSFLLTGIILLSFQAAYAQADDILGQWFTEENKGMVEITKRNGKYYGKIVWMREPLSKETGEPHIDINNPDESKRNQPIIGLEVLKDFVYVGKNQWKEGEVYDPEGGSTYRCILTLSDKNTLRVRGYIGFSLIGRTDIWKRKAF